MLQALLAARGVHCLSLGVETPIGEIVKCAAMAQIDVVAISFSSHFPARRLRSDLKEIRAMLPPTVAIMAGGGAISRIETKLDGINLVPELSEAVGFVEQFRTNRLQLSPTPGVMIAPTSRLLLRHAPNGRYDRVASTTPASVNTSATICVRPSGSPSAIADATTPMTGTAMVPIAATEAGRRASAANQLT